MATKIHGVRTGTVDGYTEHGERVKWVPRSELVLISSDGEDSVSHKGFSFPREIAANPTARQGADEFFSKAKKPVKDVARLMIGFNVGNKEVWRSGQVYLTAYLLRESQLRGKNGAPAFSFYVGLGAFPGDKVVSSEHSAQVVFMNFGQKSDDFFKDMFDLAADISDSLSQESVLLELQENGKVVYLDYVWPDDREWKDVDETKEWLKENKGRISRDVWRME